MVNEQMSSHMSIGDALVVGMLLFFAMAWVGGWAYAFSTIPDSQTNQISGFEGLLMFLLVTIPPIWAGGLVRRVIEKVSHFG